MKKITYLFLIIGSVLFAQQRTISLVSINGQTPNDFKVAQNGKLYVGTSYDFVVDFTNQETTGNNLIVKVLVAPSFADTPNVASVPITTADGQLTVTLTPTATVPSAHIQVRTTTTEDFGGSSQDNIFLFTWSVEAALSNKDFNQSKLNAYYNNSLQTIIVDEQLSGDYSIYNLLGQSVQNGKINSEINVNTLNSGLYILSTESGLLKFAK